MVGRVHGAALLSVYALGMAGALFLLALGWDRFDLGRRTWLRGRPVRIGPLRMHTTTLVSGLLLLGIGAAVPDVVLFGGVAAVALGSCWRGGSAARRPLRPNEQIDRVSVAVLGRDRS